MIDPVTAEIIKSAFTYVAEEMGVALRKAAYSPNVRERIDLSCALLDSSGRMIAQAEHIPVHLGSFPLGLKNTLNYLRNAKIKLEEGDMVLVNDPFIVGTHLNDMTLIRPVFLEKELVGYASNKAHHADIGGSAPGSISAAVSEIFQEGLVLPPIKIMKHNRLLGDVVRMIKSNVRMPNVTMGDLRAQIAANMLGEKRVAELLNKYGTEVVKSSWDLILDQTEKATRAEYAKMPRGQYEAEAYLESASIKIDRPVKIRVKVTLQSDQVNVDFTGTDPQVEGSVNAVLGVTLAATFFTIKTIIDPNISLNDGFYRTVRTHAPKGTVINALKPAAVATGNLETSQRIVDAIYKALAQAVPEKVPAASHGSMTNVIVGGVQKTGRPWAFYETIGGGYGARLGKDGVDGVHVNMTNTMNTPIEVIERYYPILFESYTLREGSGGLGRWRGGCGIDRSWRALAPMKFTIIGERVSIKPWGLLKGQPGAPSEYILISKGEKRVKLKSKDEVFLQPDDKIIIKTAGGGGYGESSKRDRKDSTES